MNDQHSVLPRMSNGVDVDEIISELATALTTPFPIRGWIIETASTSAPDKKRVFPLYSQMPVVDAQDNLVGGKVDVCVEPVYVTIKAFWKILPEMALMGKTVNFPRECLEQQYVTINVEEINLSIFVDGRKLAGKEYRVDALIPEYGHFTGLVEYWAKKWEASNRTDEIAHSMLAQLNGLRTNSLHQIRQSLQRMAGLIRSGEPDVWTIVESLMRQTISPDDAYQQSREIIRATPLRSAPKFTVQ